jgi:phage terminase large subunit GpA-like protein
MLNLAEAERRLVDLAEHKHDADPREAFRSRLDLLKPQRSISTNEFDRTRRWMVNPGGEPFRFDPRKTPYMDGIKDALDNQRVRVVAAKANTRSGKTTAFESFVLRNYTFGPITNVYWFMQDEDSINDYIDERGEEMLRLHPEVNEKVNWDDKRNSRKRKKIRDSLLLYRPATMRALRAKAAPIMGCDELDAWAKKLRDAARTLIESRQEEFGSAAKAYFCSHPDAGPDGGIDAILKDSLQHLWWVRCPHCSRSMSPAAEAEDTERRINWNVPELMALADEMDRMEFLDMVAREARLVCPHDGCHATFDADQRVGLMADGVWLQPHQRLEDDGKITGKTRVAAIMGFVIHGFMSPFQKMREAARDWAAGKLTFDATGNDVHLREVVVKKLGETFRGGAEEEVVEGWRVVQTRLSTHYTMKTVPAGVMFMTAFVDVQGDRFEVRVVGWSLAMESWLIDAYAIKQWPAFGDRSAFDNIDPSNRLSDWDVIEEAVLAASYPLAANKDRLAAGLPELFLPIARVVVNNSGVAGVTNNGRVWLHNLLTRPPAEGQRVIAPYRVLLMQGMDKGDTYGRPKQIMQDDQGRAFEAAIYERYPNVTLVKKIIARRMRLSEGGPGAMHLPSNTTPRWAQELTAERLINGKWIPSSRRNETWDGWVAAEVGRATLQPERPELWKDPVTGEARRPEWAEPRPRGQGIDSMTADPVNVFDRLLQVNRRDDRRGPGR